MMQLVSGLRWDNLKGDLTGGLTAAVVALPLALAFGVSSGAGPVAGLYGAICVGFFAALFGGTATQVSGPTGPMTVVMAAIFTQFTAADPVTDPAVAFTVVLLAGLLQILFGVLRLGKYITLVPFPVISGFMTGIGVIIILLQLGPLLGQAAASGVAAALTALPEQIARTDLASLALGGLALATVCFCPRSLGRVLPSPLLALIGGTLVYLLLLPDSGVTVIGAIPSGLPELQWPTFAPGLIYEMAAAALMLAALGSIDSLLTSLVADNLTRSQHDSDRELIGQGIGNMVAGLMGGLPGAGATMRTVVNIRAGGRTPLSGASHALFLLLLMLGAGVLAAHIPHAVLAGILLKVGIDIIDWKFLRRVHQVPFFVAALMLLVLVLTVFVDLITAVLAGVFIANVITVKRLADTQLAATRVIADQPEGHEHLSVRESEILRAAGGRILLYHFNGPVSYGAAKGIRHRLTSCRAHDALLLDFTQVPLIDVSTALALEEMILDAREAGRDVYLIGLSGTVADVMAQMGIRRLVPEERQLGTRHEALERAWQRLL